MKGSRLAKSTKPLFPQGGAYRSFFALESVLIIFSAVYAFTYKLIPKTASPYVLRLVSVAAGCLFLYYFRIEGEGEPVERSLLLVNALWVCATCIFHDSLKIDGFQACLWAVLFYCAFAFGASRTSEDRELVLDVCCVLFCAILLMVSFAGVVITITGESPFHGLGVLDRIAFLDAEGGVPPLVYVKYFNTHRNITAALFVLGMGMILSRSIRHKGRLWQIAAVVCVAVFYVSVALQHSRSNYGAAALCLSLALGVLLQERLKKRSARVRIGAVVAAVIVSTIALFLSFNMCSKALVAISQAPAQVEENVPGLAHPLSVGEPELRELSAEVELAEQPVQGEAQAEEAMRVNDNRNTLNDMRTFTGRTGIWKAVLETIRRNPGILLVGDNQWTMMDAVNEINYQDNVLHPHTHNTFLQQLLLSGVPGLLLYLGFIGALVVRMIRCYFSDAPAHLRCMTSALAAMLLYGVLEPMLNGRVQFPSLLFCLMAGCFVQEWREWCSVGTPREARRAMQDAEDREHRANPA